MNKVKLITVLLAVAMLFLTLSMTVCADHPVPDLTKKGSVNVTMKCGDEVVGGGELIICRVGDVTSQKNGDYVFTPAADFADCGIEYTDITSKSFAESLMKYAVEKKINGSTVAVSTDGKAEFKDLEPALYLVYQQKSADGYENVAPFVVGVPNVVDGEYVYDFDATPKVSVTKVPEKSAPSLPQTGQLNWPVPVCAACGVFLFASGWFLIANGKKRNEA